MDRSYSNTNDGLQLPIAIENDSVLHTLEINYSYSKEMVYSEIEINNFIEILNLCNKLNYFKCFKINMYLNSLTIRQQSEDLIDTKRINTFCNTLQYSTNLKRINRWKHNEKRTIIVTFTFPENYAYSLSNSNKMEAMFKLWFANDVNLIFHTKVQKYQFTVHWRWTPDSISLDEDISTDEDT